MMRFFFRILILFACTMLFGLADFCIANPSNASDVINTFEDKLPEIDRTFFIETDEDGSFTYIESEDFVSAVWEGNVVAYTEQIRIETQRLELDFFDDNQIKSLKALPDVKIELVHDQTRAVIYGKQFTYDFENRTGNISDSQIELVASPEAFELPYSDDYYIYIFAQNTMIDNDDYFVEQPELRFNSIDNPELVVAAKSLTIDTYDGTRYAHINKPSVKIFGTKIITYPWTYHLALTDRAKRGFMVDIPRFGFGDGGFNIDQRFHYAFAGGLLKNKYVTVRTDVYTNDRWYPQIGLSENKKDWQWGLLYGYERGKDVDDNRVLVFKNPDFNLQSKPHTFLKRYKIKGGFDYGFIEEPSLDVSSNRFRINTKIKREPIQLGTRSRSNIELELHYERSFYSSGDDYEILTKGIGYSHREKRDFAFKTTYYKRDHKGSTPFLHDEIDILDEINLMTRFSLTDEYGIGFDGRYDIDQDKFRNFEFLITKNLNSFQVGLGWDFARSNLTIDFGFPGRF